MTVAAASAARQPSSTLTSLSTTSPFKLTGNANPQRIGLFSTFDFVSDPAPFIPAVPHGTPVVPFTTAVLPLGDPSTLYFQPRPLSTPSPSQALPAFPHPGLTSLRARTVPSHYPTAHPKALSLSYQREGHWRADPHVEASHVDLHRSSRPHAGQRPWKVTTTAASIFNDERGGWDMEERQGRPKVEVQGRAQHGGAWRGGASQRAVGDRGQLAGRVEGYRLSPFERSDGLKAKLAADGMREGYRAQCQHTHAAVRIGAHAKTLSSGRFHSSRSGVCRHRCTQGL